VLLATFVCTLGTSGLTTDHLGLLDTACGDVAIASSTDAPRVNTDSTSPPEHCPVCHYLRAVSGATATEPVQLSVVDGQAVPWVFHRPHLSEAEPAVVASRGPPHLDSAIVI
jgi:hypothetical protein